MQLECMMYNDLGHLCVAISAIKSPQVNRRREVIVDTLINPNIAYLLLVAGFFFAILALMAPGTGLLEAGALITLILAGWEISYLPINVWALLVLLLGVLPFMLAVRRSQRLIYLVIAILTLIVGSTFLFQGEGLLPAVNPVLAIVVSTLTGVFMWIATTKILEASRIRPEHDLKKLIGAVGEAKTDIHAGGSVQVAGELWTARSTQNIPIGSSIRVVGRDGFILDVELLEHSEDSSGETLPQN
jgi:membrane-bound serine protease (ClpP class)